MKAYVNVASKFVNSLKPSAVHVGAVVAIVGTAGIGLTTTVVLSVKVTIQLPIEISDN